MAPCVGAHLKHSMTLLCYLCSPVYLKMSVFIFPGPTWATRTSPTDRTVTCCWRTAGRSPTSSPTWWKPSGTFPFSCSPTTPSPCWRAWCTRTKVETKRERVCTQTHVYPPTCFDTVWHSMLSYGGTGPVFSKRSRWISLMELESLDRRIDDG